MPEVIYERSPELKRAAAGLIDEYHQHLLDAEIIYMWRTGRWCIKGVNQYGKTMIVPQLWHELTGYDLVVIVNKQAYLHQQDSGRRALLDNLLCQFALTGGGSYQTREHDIKEFSDAVRRNNVCMSNLSALDGANEIKKLEVPDEPERPAEEEMAELGFTPHEGEDEELFVIEDMEAIDDTDCTVKSLFSFEK